MRNNESMSLSSKMKRVEKLLRTYAAIGVARHVPHNLQRFKVGGIEHGYRVFPAASDCVKYQGELEATVVKIPSSVYKSTAEFMQTEPLGEESGELEFSHRTSAWKIHKGRVYSYRSSQYFVLSQANRIVSEVSFKHEDARYGVPENKLTLDAKYFPEPMRFSGKVATLILGGGPATNIFHWMIDALPTLALLEKICPLSKIDHFVVQGADNGFRLKSLEMLGIPAHKVHFVSQPIIHIQADELLAANQPRGRLSNVTPKWVIDFHRERYLPKITSLANQNWPEKIYVSRRDSSLRGVKNEEQVIESLKARGYTEIVLSDYSFDEKIALFHHARDIVSMSGAAFAFLVYCQPKARVLEMFPAGFVHYANVAIANQLELDYRYEIFGNKGGEKSGYSAQREGMFVDCGRMLSALK